MEQVKYFNLGECETTIKLRQITPMIHFQHSEDGVVLRTSEVKPKLDRFLHDLGVIKSNWCDKHGSLFYRMIITAPRKTPDKKSNMTDAKIASLNGGRITENVICKSYFANQGGKSEQDVRESYKETIFYESNEYQPESLISLQVICKFSDLLETIKKYISIFFLLHNFGTRQSKGFGSFLVRWIDDKKLDSDEMKRVKDFFSSEAGKKSKLFESEFFYVDYNVSNVSESQKMKDIALIYGFLKSGYNFTKKFDRETKKMVASNSPDDYFRGFIFRYFHNKELGNDKAYIKQYVLKEEHKRISKGEHKRFQPMERKKYRYVRGMLGISEYVEFRHVGSKKKVYYQNFNDDKIERFNSPILFKVTDKYVFIFLRKIPDAMYNAKFCISNIKRTGKDEVHDNEWISTPSTNEFNLVQFLEAFAYDFNDKTTQKCGKIGIRAARNQALQAANSLEILSSRGVCKI